MVRQIARATARTAARVARHSDERLVALYLDMLAAERGAGKNPGDEGYFVLKGTLTENASDANKKITSHSQEVAFKMFPQDAAPAK